ncbi:MULTISPECIES: transketolase [unclassified Candidatus Frackibacter]|uniref:transketolase n=1 Tax=unclassified Candidatus Frackibacter TaxID=2648818 RepID=UPI0007918B7A|nr:MULTISPECIES: transketolase [unclassified Candidatus Frackibacter]KXS40810.1 MAG: transketolase [Candidatus Frackibacter sp. T328-2]SDC83559.1 transketolase [Candidatus Frackibacter sp. WG11]SEM98044.1 transketolase [Candidatus Frackibacter sp. WG12]SFM04773.1 transketolase [Candidatus Frackibacter sp. WG13]
MTKIKQLEDKAREIRRSILKMVGAAGSGHPGGSLSATDIVTALYFKEMNLDPHNPDWDERDRFILSKGHAAPVLYAALAEKGYFPKEELQTLRRLDSHLQGHPDMKKTPGVDMTTGSLGQGISAAVGMALAGKLDQKDYRVFTMLGDGEIEEGQVWEAAMSAGHHKLDNLIGFVDNNRLQLVGKTEEILDVHPVGEKFEAFGWHVIEIDGHDMKEILKALDEAKEVQDKPIMVVANTVKGKGVSFMEGEAGWHGNAPNEEELKKALAELH